MEKRFENIWLKTKVTNIETIKEGVIVYFEGDDVPEKLTFDRVLVAVGRKPNGHKIDAENAGVKVDDHGFIAVDKQMKTNIDHIYAHQVPIALSEFYRVLKDDGIVFVRCPDIQSVCEAVLQDKLLDPFYETEDGTKIAPLDILFGNREEISEGNEYMTKKCGFTYSVLNTVFADAGFKARYGGRIPFNGAELALVAFKQKNLKKKLRK